MTLESDPFGTAFERSLHMRFGACAVYMLGNLNRTVLYTGVTNDLVRRVWEHREHVNPTAFTARYGVDRLVYYEAFDDIAAAIGREKQIKGWSRRKKNTLIAEANPEWEDLWPQIVG
jgi:putative endonuclease